jgi:hypothetical protein
MTSFPVITAEAGISRSRAVPFRHGTPALAGMTE